ncbi:MAG: phage/plasmid primase, P4 family [Lachnospiraceae bacterium]|nr:phage/plasmid primase, P4 family [Lachnospiraceae bacterium]
MGTAVNFINIPAELKSGCRFCVWKMEKGTGKSTRLTKIPYNPVTGGKAQTNNADTFAPFAEVMKSYAMGGYDGIGIRVAAGIGAIDIDHCIREDGSLNDVAASVLGIFKDAYFERSPSGSGLRGFFRVEEDFVFDKTIYYINNRTHGLEVYLPGATNRFVTVTGNQYRAGSVPLDMSALQTVLDSFMKRKTQVTNTHIEPCSYLTDEQVIEHAKASASGERFMDYYEGNWQKYFDNQSDADMGFLSMLSFWCGCDEEQIDRIFRSSGMMRPKWDRQQAGTTYGAISIRNAVSTCQHIYTPVDVGGAEDDFENLDQENEIELDFRPDLSQITITLDDMQVQSNPRYQRDEIGIGNIFADYFQGVARYNRDRGVWYIYDGTVWRADTENLKVSELAKLLANRLYSYALTIKEEDARKRYIDRVKKLQQRKHRETMIKDAKSVHPVPMAVFDRDIYLFNMANGTLNLRTGEFQKHNASDFLTKISPVVYDPEAACPRFASFMEEVMMGDEPTIRYTQKSLGYALSGDTRMECFFILHGATSRNGKGTLMETFLRLTGDYGRNADPVLLAMKYNAQSNGPTEELARLAGSRFVNISEPEKKLTIDAALTKRLTGNDTITARFLHENSFEFRPGFKIFINTNHKPNITDSTLFSSGRVKLIPFNRHFDEAEQDKGLKAFFAEPENMSGIFNWMYEGFKLYLQEGLEMPQVVREATNEYELESDKIGQFFAACVIAAPGKELRRQAVFDRYKTWCKDNNFHAESMKIFRPELEKRFECKKKRPEDDKAANATPMVLDIAFVPEENPEPELVPID